MSISKQGLENVKPTAANASISPPNFAVAGTFPEPVTTLGPNQAAGPDSITDTELSLVQVCVDFMCVCIALPLSLVLLSSVSAAQINSYAFVRFNTAVDCLFPLAAVVALALGGTYRASHRRLQPSAFLEMRELSFGIGAGCVLALAAGAFLHAAIGMIEPNPTQLVFAVIVSIGVVSVGRIAMRFMLHSMTTTRVLVIGTGNVAERVMLSVQHDSSMTLVGRVVDDDVIDDDAIGRVSDLPRLCRELNVQRVLVASFEEISGDAVNTYRRLQDSVHIAIMPQYFQLVSWRSRLTDLAGMPFLEVARPHLSLWDQFMKRLFDLMISSVVLLLASPLLLAVAIAVKLSSPGPVFFRQVRLGRHEVPFTITKFRSMTVDTAVVQDAAWDDSDFEGRPLHEIRGKVDESCRITPIGAFLRRTGIDEIPQFISVFRGDMSVVGPRPFIPEESKVSSWGSRRFDVRPGITGLWQVSGRNDLSRRDLVQLDYLYVASWSLWWDLKIMWETPKTMARGTGAY
jgi:exopolysaccharide biosynthesis polyprenyl glycosylphosphotransferase